MKKALGLFGLAAVLFVILLIGPFVKSFTEGFSEILSQEEMEKMKQRVKETEEKTQKLMKEIETLDNLLKNPTLEQSTKDKIVKEKADLEEELKKVTGATLPPAATPEAQTTESFQPSNSSSSIETFMSLR